MAQERWGEKRQKFPLEGRGWEKHLRAETLCLCVHVYLSVHIFVFVPYWFLKECKWGVCCVHVSITQKPLCVCVFFPPLLSSLSTFTLSLSLCWDLLPQLDCSPPFPLTVLPLHHSLLHSYSTPTWTVGPSNCPLTGEEELKSLPSLCLSKGFLPFAHTCSILASSLIVRKGLCCWLQLLWLCRCCLCACLCILLSMLVSQLSVTSHWDCAVIAVTACYGRWHSQHIKTISS